MPPHPLRSAAALVALALSATASPAPWTLILLAGDDVPSPSAGGPSSLDGSPAGFYLRYGTGANKTKFVLFFEGGGWAVSESDALARSKTALGSSTFLQGNTSAWEWEGLLTSDCARNPDWCTWSSVYFPYLDGASFSGNAALPLVVNGTSLYFRGHVNLDAALTALLSPLPAPSVPGPSLANATEVIVSGGSAGGLAALLHVDFIAARVADAAAAAATTTGPPRVTAVTNCGFFLDGADVWGTSLWGASIFPQIAAMQNVTGSANNTNANCWAAMPAAERWRCFLAPFVYPFVRTPSFVVNSQYDSFQLQYLLAPLPGSLVEPGPDPAYSACVGNLSTEAAYPPPASACNASMLLQVHGWSAQFAAQLNMSRSAALAIAGPAAAAESGGVITSCVIHGQLDAGDWTSIRVGGDAGPTLQEAVGAWYYGRPGALRGTFHFDGRFPSNPTCPKHDRGERRGVGGRAASSSTTGLWHEPA
jgi:hypothetical protein